MNGYEKIQPALKKLDIQKLSAIQLNNLISNVFLAVVPENYQEWRRETLYNPDISRAILNGTRRGFNLFQRDYKGTSLEDQLRYKIIFNLLGELFHKKPNPNKKITPGSQGDINILARDIIKTFTPEAESTEVQKESIKNFNPLGRPDSSSVSRKNQIKRPSIDVDALMKQGFHAADFFTQATTPASSTNTVQSNYSQEVASTPNPSFINESQDAPSSVSIDLTTGMMDPRALNSFYNEPQSIPNKSSNERVLGLNEQLPTYNGLPRRGDTPSAPAPGEPIIREPNGTPIRGSDMDPGISNILGMF